MAGLPKQWWFPLMRSLRSPTSLTPQKPSHCSAPGHGLQYTPPQRGDAGRPWSPSWVSAASVGHCGLQIASKLDFRTVAIAREADKAALSHQLGAHYFIDSATEDVAARLNVRCGTRAVLATVTSAKAMTPAMRRRGGGNLHDAVSVGAAMCSAFCCGSHDRWP
jgi:hypothetical protein